MKTESPHILLATPFGNIAISLGDVAVARQKADELIGERVEYPTDISTHESLISAEQIAELFEMDATWFLTQAREDRLPHLRLGKYVRFDPDEICEFFHREVK